jgi:hypothetical protein
MISDDMENGKIEYENLSFELKKFLGSRESLIMFSEKLGIYTILCKTSAWKWHQFFMWGLSKKLC